jgi:hypothetical protein
VCQYFLGVYLFICISAYTPPQLFINYLWFGLDCIIVIQLLKYGKDEFPYLSSKRLYSIFVVLLISEFSLILINGIIIGEFKGVYPAFGQNLVMSILFIIMLFKRNGLRGQSIYIAVFKMLGTGLTSVHYYLYEPITQSSFILPSLYILIFIFDMIYICLIIKQYKKNKIDLLKI